MKQTKARSERKHEREFGDMLVIKDDVFPPTYQE